MNAPRDYMDGLIKRIVGVAIVITPLAGKSKLGQDEEPRDIMVLPHLQEWTCSRLMDVTVSAIQTRVLRGSLQSTLPFVT